MGARDARISRFRSASISVFCCSDALATTLSALYGKLLVVMGIAFPMAEVISTYIPPSFYEAFYLYLYFGSMIFLMYMYAMLFRDGKTKPSESLWSAYIWQNCLFFSSNAIYIYINPSGERSIRVDSREKTGERSVSFSLSLSPYV